MTSNGRPLYVQFKAKHPWMCNGRPLYLQITDIQWIFNSARPLDVPYVGKKYNVRIDIIMNFHIYTISCNPQVEINFMENFKRIYYQKNI